MILKSFLALVGSAAALVGSSKLSSTLRNSSAPESSLEVREATTTLEDIVPPTPIETVDTKEETPEAAVEVVKVEAKEEVVEVLSEVEIVPALKVETEEEVVPAPKKEETREPVYYGRYTLKKYFAGGPGHRHAAFAPKTNFFGQAENIKRNDSAIWNDFVAAATNRSTDEDILESACKNLSNRDKISFDGRDYLKNKIKAYCFVQIGFKL